MEIVTKSGYKCLLAPAAFDDWEIAELSIAYQDGDKMAGIRLIDKMLSILGEEQAAALKKHVTVDGRVSMTGLDREIAEIMGAAGKNS